MNISGVNHLVVHLFGKKNLKNSRNNQEDKKTKKFELKNQEKNHGENQKNHVKLFE